jgi:hypothetical protein
LAHERGRLRAHVVAEDAAEQVRGQAPAVEERGRPRQLPARGARLAAVQLGESREAALEFG